MGGESRSSVPWTLAYVLTLPRSGGGQAAPSAPSRAPSSLRSWDPREHPVGVERYQPVAAPAALDEVTCARIHRQPSLGRVPAVVPLDQVVDRVEALPGRVLAPAAGPDLGIGLAAPKLLPVAAELLL